MQGTAEKDNAEMYDVSSGGASVGYAGGAGDASALYRKAGSKNGCQTAGGFEGGNPHDPGNLRILRAEAVCQSFDEKDLSF